MKSYQLFSVGAAVSLLVMLQGAPAWAVTGIQIGPSGKTYASSSEQCALHPVNGMAPVVQAGLYDPKRKASAVVSLNGTPTATVTFFNPDTSVWLANGINTVDVMMNKRTTDSYTFDASLSYPNQPNMCIPDTSGNSIIGDLEYAPGLVKSYATVTPGCAFNPLTGGGQPYVNLFTNGPYLLNVSVNNVPLTQLNGNTHDHTPVFLSAGLNVITVTHGSISTDYYVRNGGTGTCTLP